MNKETLNRNMSPEDQIKLDRQAAGHAVMNALADSIRAESKTRLSQPLAPLAEGAITGVPNPFKTPPNPDLAVATGGKDETHELADKRFGVAASFTKDATGSRGQSSFAPQSPNREVVDTELARAIAVVKE